MHWYSKVLLSIQSFTYGIPGHIKNMAPSTFIVWQFLALNKMVRLCCPPRGITTPFIYVIFLLSTKVATGKMRAVFSSQVRPAMATMGATFGVVPSVCSPTVKSSQALLAFLKSTINVVISRIFHWAQAQVGTWIHYYPAHFHARFGIVKKFSLWATTLMPKTGSAVTTGKRVAR